MSQHCSFGFLKNVAINNKTAQDNLEDLKSLFRNEIGSARNMYRIQTMDDLIDCLERHDALSETNIEPLREIADQYGGELEEAVTSYVIPKELISAEPRNKYQEIRLAEELRSQMNISGGQRSFRNDVHLSSHQQQQRQPVYQMSANTTTLETPNPPQPMLSRELSKEKRAAIYKVIAREIGLFWRSFGRELDIPQGIMDEIEIQYPRDLQTRIYKMFQAFEEDESVDPKKHFILICRALDESRRKDLRRKIEKIMSH